MTRKLSYSERMKVTGVDDVRDWLFVREETVSKSPDGKVSKNAPKERFMIIEHRVTGEQRWVKL